MASLRKPKGPFLSPDGQTAKFLYLIIKQLDLKTIDWNEVASGLEITNGHAARMRFSRFKQQVEGTTKKERAPRKKPDGIVKSTKGKGKLKGLDEEGKEKAEHLKKDNAGDVRMKEEADGSAELLRDQATTVKQESLVKQEPDCPGDEGSSAAEPLPVDFDYNTSFHEIFPALSPDTTPIKLERNIQKSPQIWSPTNMPPPPSPMPHPVYPSQNFMNQTAQHYPHPSSPYPTVVSMADLQLLPTSSTNSLYAYEAVDPGLSVPRYLPQDTLYPPYQPGQAAIQQQSIGSGSRGGTGNGQDGQTVKMEPTYS